MSTRYDFAFNASSTTWSCPKSRNFCNCSHCLRKAGFAYILDMGKRRGKGEARGPNCKAPSVATQAKAKGYSSICRYLRSKGYGLGVEGEENKKQPDVEEEVIEETPPRDEVDPSPEKNMVNLPDEPEEEKIEINVTAHKRTLKLTLHTRPLPPKDQPSTSNGDSQRRRSIFDSPTELDDPLQSIDGEPSTPSLPPSSSPQEPTFSLPSPPPSSKYTFPMFSHDTTTVHGDPYSESHSLRQSYQEYLDAIPSSEIESFPFAHLASILGDGEDENDEDASATLGLYYKDSSPPALDTIIADHHTEGGASTSYPPTANTATLDLDLDLDTTTHIDITPQPELYPAYAAPSYLDTSDPNTSPTSAWEPTHTRAHTDDSTTLTLCPTFDGMEVTSHDSASSIGVGVVGEYDWSHAMMNPRLLRGAKFEDLGPTLVDSTVMVDDHIAEDFTF